MTGCDSILLVSTRLGEKSPLGFQTLENGPFEGGVDIPKLKLTWNRLIGNKEHLYFIVAACCFAELPDINIVLIKLLSRRSNSR